MEFSIRNNSKNSQVKKDPTKIKLRQEINMK